MSDKPSIPGEGKLIGKVTHYYNNIGVAIIEMSATLKAGDNIRIIGGEVDFEQMVESIEVDHKKVKAAKAKETIGIKVGEKVREGYRVYKV